MSVAPAPTSTTQHPRPIDEPLQVLYDRTRPPAGSLPAELCDTYGGELSLDRTCLYGNFVSSLDGVVALGPEYPSSGSAISGRKPADRFVMGLLRAFADAVFIGAGTLRATQRHHWTAEHVWPAGTACYTEMRRRGQQSPRPLLVVVSGRGDLPIDHPALSQPTLLVTTTEGRNRMADRLPTTVEVATVGDGPHVPIAGLLDLLHERGCRRVLTEGGPHLLGQLVDHQVLDELFLTVSPDLAGRGRTARPGLVSDLELLPHRRIGGELVGVRRHGDYLFLRYRFGQKGASHDE